MKKGIIYLYWGIAILYSIVAIYIVLNANSIVNSNTFAVIIGGTTVLSLGLAMAGLAYSFSVNKKNDDQINTINKKIDTLIKNNPKRRIK